MSSGMKWTGGGPASSHFQLLGVFSECGVLRLDIDWSFSYLLRRKQSAKSVNLFLPGKMVTEPELRPSLLTHGDQGGRIQLGPVLAEGEQLSGPLPPVFS